MLTRSSRSHGLSATEQRHLARQRRQKKPTKAAAHAANRKTATAAKRKRKAHSPPPISSEPKETEKPGKQKDAADDLVAHAANALCLIRVQQEQTAAGSVEHDGQIAAGEQLAAEKNCDSVYLTGEWRYYRSIDRQIHD